MTSICCHSNINTICSWLNCFLSVPIPTPPCIPLWSCHLWGHWLSRTSSFHHVWLSWIGALRHCVSMWPVISVAEVWFFSCWPGWMSPLGIYPALSLVGRSGSSHQVQLSPWQFGLEDVNSRVWKAAWYGGARRTCGEGISNGVREVGDKWCWRESPVNWWPK